MVPMTRGPDSGDGRGYTALQEVRAYWDGLRVDSALPGRAQIDPRGMDRALEHVFLIERIAPGNGRFRLAGMHLSLLMGMEVRGMPLSSLFEPESRPQLHDLLEAVFGGALSELSLQAGRGIGRPHLEGRMLLLPVVGDDGICDRALGCLVALGAIGRGPRRFTISKAITDLPQKAASARSFHFSAIARPQALPRPAFAEAPKAYVVSKTPVAAVTKRSRAHLRLVKSDD